MKNLLAAGCGLAIISVFSLPIYASPSMQSNVQHVINSTHHIPVDSLRLGIIVQSMSNNHFLYERNAQSLYTPASTQKLLTATAALSFLKPDYHYETNILSYGTIENGVLHGNLVFKFSGDPLLTVSDLKQMIAELKAKGLRRVEGHVYIDRNDYANVPYPPGWFWDDLSYGYAAPMSAIIINHNKYALSYIPAKHNNQRPFLKNNLPPGVVDYTNQMITTSRYYPNCPATVYSDDQNRYTFHGCLNRHWGVQSRSLAMRDMTRYAEKELAALLRNADIVYSGSIGLHNPESNMHILVNHESVSLTDIVHEMLKKSDNLTANSLFKKLGETYFHTHGNWDNSALALKKILAPSGVEFQKILITDGAGGSRYNLISPYQMSKLLLYIYHNPTVKGPLMAALPIAGRDGTLRYRMPEFGKTARVRAKTGSMTSVTALAGFAQTRHYGTVSFVIMLNGFIGKRPPYIALEDRIAKAITNS